MMQEYDYEFAEFLYYTPGTLDREGGIWPVRAGRSRAKPNYNAGPKRIECYSLHFIHDGKVRFSYGGRQVELQKDDLFCLFPGITYQYEQVPAAQPLRMNWLALDGERAGQLLELIGLTPEKPYGRKLASHAARQAADRVIRTLADTQRWHAAGALELQARICQLFAELLADSAAASGHEAEPSGWIEACREYMELHATEGITVQQVAAFAGLHRSYFTQTFASRVGMPPMKYIQKIRMDKAKRLLKETNASITEIALSLGYPNLYAFTRAFKMYYQVSPLAIRATP